MSWKACQDEEFDMKYVVYLSKIEEIVRKNADFSSIVSKVNDILVKQELYFEAVDSTQILFEKKQFMTTFTRKMSVVFSIPQVNLRKMLIRPLKTRDGTTFNLALESDVLEYIRSNSRTIKEVLLYIRFITHGKEKRLTKEWFEKFCLRWNIQGDQQFNGDSLVYIK